MCLGIPARVTAAAQGSDPVGSDLVQVEMAGVPRLVNVGLLDARPEAGDWLLVHMGFALSTMTEAEASEAMAALSQMSAERTGIEWTGIERTGIERTGIERTGMVEEGMAW